MKEHGSFPYHIAQTLTARRICLGHSIPSILIYKYIQHGILYKLCWLFVLRIYVAYLDAGNNQSLKFKWRIEPCNMKHNFGMFMMPFMGRGQ